MTARARLLLPVLAVLLLGVGAGWALLRAPTPGPPPETAMRRAPSEPASVEAPGPPTARLRGDPTPPPPTPPRARPSSAPPSPAIPSPAQDAEAVVRDEAAVQAALDWLDNRHALAPEGIPDQIRATTPPPIALTRDELHDVRWDGVARIVADRGGPPRTEDDTEAPAATAVRGRVVDEQGAGIAGAEVILHSSFYLRQAYYDHRVREIGRAFTDRNGAFDLRPLDLDTVHFGRDGEVLATVRHPAHADLVVRALRGLVPGRESDVGALVLPSEPVVVRGTLRDLEGEPVVGARVIASGALNPVDYDKQERWVVLDDCPTTSTDHEGRYELTGFAGGLHEISFHVNADCVLHVRRVWSGEADLSPRVRAGNEIRGRVVDPDGTPVAAAVVSGGGNWTPTNPDGSFWLDNVAGGPLRIEVSHHLWRTLVVDGVETNTDEETVLTLAQRLPRIGLEVVDEGGAPVSLVAIRWVWAPGTGPDPFVPDSPWWHDERGVLDVVVPEHAVGARVTSREGEEAHLTADDLMDGAKPRLVLAPPTAAEDEAR